MNEHEELDREAAADDLDDSPPECDSKSSSKSSEAAEVLSPHAAACSYWMHVGVAPTAR